MRIVKTKYINKAGELVERTYQYEQKRTKYGSKVLVGVRGIPRAENIKAFKQFISDEDRKIFNDILAEYIIDGKKLTSDLARKLIKEKKNS